MTTRRSFFSQAGLGLAAATAAPALFTRPAHAQPAAADTNTPADTFRLGIAGYTFYKFNLDQTLEMLKKVDVHYLCIKSFHLPLNSTDQEIAAFHAKCKGFGVTGYGVGPIYMSNEKEVNDAFAYAKRVGTRTLVGVPSVKEGKRYVASPAILKLVNEKVKEYDINFAIHNHGPDMPENFPNAESGMELIKDLDPRVGLCLDIGHQFRDGKDPVKAILDYSSRIYDLHIKNVTAPSKSGKGIEMPRGMIDMTAVVRALRKVKYSGVCSLEYEKDMTDPLTGIAESIGYFRGIMDATR